MCLSTHFLENDEEIFCRDDSIAKDTMDNCRGACWDYEIAVNVEVELLVEILEPPELLGPQQLESAQPKKMILSLNHFWRILWRKLVRWSNG